MDTNLEENRVLFAAGDGTAENPFVILDRDGLEAVSDNLSAHYKLGRILIFWEKRLCR